MKLITFEVKTMVGNFERLGCLHESQIVDLNFAHAALREKEGKAAPQRGADALVPSEMLAFLDGGTESLSEAERALKFMAERMRRHEHAFAPGGQQITYAQNEVKWLAPVPRPRALRDFFAFEEHALKGAERRKEPLAKEWYDQPVYYKGNHRQIFGPDAAVPWPSYTRKLDFELEIGCVVGKKGHDLSPAQALDHIAGYTILNDFSARDIQRHEMLCRMGPAKGKDFATGLGPYLLTRDELAEPKNLKMSVKVNGEAWSSGSSSGCYWSFPVMLSHVSQEETVYPGDLLGSGTYYRGCGLDLDRWIKPGDVIELEVEKLGTLRQVVGAPKGEKHLVYKKNGAYR